MKAAKNLYRSGKEDSTSVNTTNADLEIYSGSIDPASEGTSSQHGQRHPPHLEGPDPDFYWLASDGWGKQKQVVANMEEFALGAITVELESKKIAGFDDYMKTLTPEDNDRNLW